MRARHVVMGACAAFALGTRAGDQPASAQGTSASKQQDTATSAQGTSAGSKTVSGTVQKMEKDKLTVQTDQQGKTRDVELKDSTKFSRDGQEISRDQIKEGDHVRASYSGEAEPVTATEIVVITIAPAEAGTGSQTGQGDTAPKSTPPAGESKPSTSGQSGQR